MAMPRFDSFDAQLLRWQPNQQQPGLIGFPDVGNTCYLNSVLQCLLRCAPLVQHVLRYECSGGVALALYQHLLQQLIYSINLQDFLCHHQQRTG